MKLEILKENRIPKLVNHQAENIILAGIRERDSGPQIQNLAALASEIIPYQCQPYNER